MAMALAIVKIKSILPFFFIVLVFYCSVKLQFLKISGNFMTNSNIHI